MMTRYTEVESYLLSAYPNGIAYFLWCWLTLKQLLKVGKRFGNFSKRAHTVKGYPDNTRLFGQALHDRLTNPPYSIRDKFKTARLIESLRCFDKAYISFIDQVT